MKDLFGNQVPKVQPIIKRLTKAPKSNPCIPVYGHGPADTRCKTCVHFKVKHLGKKYFKCLLRGNTGSPATDHRANWPTCGKYALDMFAELKN